MKKCSNSSVIRWEKCNELLLIRWKKSNSISDKFNKTLKIKIQYCSDLHMEFRENMRFMKSLPLEPVGDVLVIAGDVGYLVDTTIPHLRFWKWASENYRQVMMIAGNHEFYNDGDIAAQGESWQKMFLPNVGYYHNKVVRIDKRRLHPFNALVKNTTR